MAAIGLPYLVIRGGIFYFRRAIPGVLVPVFRRHEIKVSLETGHPPTATIRCRELTNAFERLLWKVQGMKAVSQEQIDAMVRTYFERGWAKANEIVVLGPQDVEFDPVYEAELTAEDAKNIQRRLMAHDVDPAIRLVAGDVLAEHGQSFDALDIEGLKLLCQGLLRAQAEQRRMLVAMLQGRFSDAAPTDPLFAGMKSPGLPPMDGTGVKSVTDPLSDVIDTYQKHIKMQTYPVQTLNEKVRVLQWLMDFVGKDRPIAAVGVEDMREFRDTMRRLPAHFTMRPRFKGLTLRELAALEGETLIATNTAEKNLSHVRAFFEWAVGDKYLQSSPAAGLKLTSGKQAKKKKPKLPFSTEQLKAIFDCPLYRGSASVVRRHKPGSNVYRDANFWIPLIGLYTGARMGEIIQLQLDDIKEFKGVWYFDVTINDEDDDDEVGDETAVAKRNKGLKTENSKRVIPVHPFLIKAGFIEFCALRRKASPTDGRVFSEIKPGPKGEWSKRYSKWFTRFLIQNGIKTKAISFHSFRHSFVDAMRAANVQDSCQYALVGHASKAEKVTTQKYGEGYMAESLYPSMAKIAYDLDLSHLLPAEYPASNIDILS